MSLSAHSHRWHRRRVLAAGVASACLAAGGNGSAQDNRSTQDSGQPKRSSALPTGVAITLPRDRVPVSFVIDDSTCLVNMGHFCNPQFATAWPDRAEYKKPWRDWPREIPDSFVRQFGQWCAEHNVKGKYSIVPYPACVGWLDRELPGWTRRELTESLDLVRELMVPHWDIHPEMISHTRVIDLKTGRPLEEISKATMENSFPQEKKSVDELAAYLAYALRILKNCGLPCEGVTTPGGFGNAVKEELPVAVHQAVRDVFGSELPHYFKYVETQGSTQPKLENLSGVGTDSVSVTANVLAGTGDWFGGWQGVDTVERDRYLSEDGQSGRLAELIRDREPAVMLCHWPGMYNNGTQVGFQAFQSIVKTIASVYGDQTVWMKLSEIGRYWTAKELTEITRVGDQFNFDAAFACPDLTLSIKNQKHRGMVYRHGASRQALTPVTDRSALKLNSFVDRDGDLLVCLDLPKGESQLMFDLPK
jgi:hypothetical protein